jgi:hypothetical protein
MTDYGPPDTYEVVWTSGHVERIQAHQVTWPLDFTFSRHDQRDRHVMLHGEIEGRWKLVLSAPVEQIHSVRLVAAGRGRRRARVRGGRQR